MNSFFVYANLCILLLTLCNGCEIRPLHVDITKREGKGCEKVLPTGQDFNAFNYIIGTQTFKPIYQFTGNETLLVETANQILNMGSNTIKILVGSTAIEDYKLPPNPEINSLAELLDKEPSFRKVLNMPFYYYLFWVYPSQMNEGIWGEYYNWTEGFSQQERMDEYNQIYDLTCYLLTRFNNTGKTFFLGHWEGDWAIMGEPFEDDRQISQKALEGMIQRMNNRQLAIDNAKADTSHQNISVYHYTEVRLVHRGKRGLNSITTDVLPYTNVDYISYSSYDSLFRYLNMDTADRKEKVRKYLISGLNWIESHLPKKDIPGKRVFIGEYGFPVHKDNLTPETQDELTRVVMRVALEWGCPFVLYWQLYENEAQEGAINPSGYWLIDDKGQKQPVYHTHRTFLTHAQEYVENFRKKHGKNPTQDDYRKIAVKWLKD